MQFRNRFRNRGNQPESIPRTNRTTVSLTCLYEGEKGVLAHTSGGYGIIRRLAEMGLTSGTEIKLLRKCPFHGPVEVEVRGVSLALGYGVATRVFVKPSKAESNG